MVKIVLSVIASGPRYIVTFNEIKAYGAKQIIKDGQCGDSC